MSISQLTPCEPERKMWFWVVFFLFLVHIASPKPTVDDAESARQPRQLDFGECCPCPDKNDESFRNQARWLPQNGRTFVEHQGNQRQFPDDMGFSRSGFDDCPCRSRGADSEGSSSIFFPSALRPSGPLSKPPDSKEDPKNLLEPEVGLASSVLETLREATDEEYRDALARDAARSRATEDVTPEESAQNIITIILPNASDDEDIISDPSHIQESRCIHPLGSTLSRMSTPVEKSPSLLPDLFRVSKSKPIGLVHRNGLDMDSGFAASNVHESLDDTNARSKKLKTNPIIMKSVMNDVCDAVSRKGNANTDSLLERQQEFQQTDALKSSNNLKIMNMKSNEECNRSDMKSAASDRKELFSDIPNPGLKLGPLLTENSPLNIKNLLKLRDVELIPPGQLIEKLKLGQSAFQIPTLIENMPKLSDLLKNGIKFDLNKNGKWNNAKNDDKSLEDASSSTNIQVIPRDKTFSTEILDALPSTSNINEVQDNCDVGQETVRIKPKPLSKIPTKTAIIESMPNSFHPAENVDHAVFDNDVDVMAKSGEDDCDFTQNVSQDDIISNSSQEEQFILDIDGQEDTQSRVKSEVSGQEFGTNECLETIHDEVPSSENSDEILPKDVSNSDMKPLVTVEEEDQRRNTIIDNAKTSLLLNNQKVSPLTQSFKSVKESVLRKIEESKRTSKMNKGDKLRESNIERNTDSYDFDSIGKDCDTEPSENILSLSPNILNTDDKKLKSSNTVQLEDLQKLSDSLLKKSLLTEKTTPDIEHNDCSDDIASKKDDRSVEKPLSDNKFHTIDSDTASNKPHTTEIRDPSYFYLMPQSNEVDNKDRPSDSNLDIKNSPKSLRNGIDVNEMAVEASEPVMGTIHDPLQLFKNTNLGSPLFENIVVQPSSLFEGLRNPPSLDLGAALNFPTLDDLRERLGNVFGRNYKDTDEDVDCPNKKPIMSAEPSTSNFISRSPSIPLQDLNLDIFQLKPPTSGKSNTLSKIPRVNLKSFRTKVAVPNNLELKPLRLQSTVGNKGGLLGATLTLGRDSVGIPKLLETLGNPPQNLPILNEMITRMRTNVENLVQRHSNPLDLSRNIDSIPRIDDITNSLRSNTENTIRALQGRMGSTLGRPHKLLSNSPGKPEDILERIVDAKEDMEAKIKGLHYDLNDRLTSIHDNIFDHTGLSSLNSLFEGSSLSRNAFNNNEFNGAKRLNTPTSKRLKVENKKETLGKTANLKSKSPSDRKADSIASQRKFKMPAAASVPVPKTIEAPKLKSTLHKPLSSTGNDPKMRLVLSRIKPLDSENNNFLKLPSKHFQENGILSKHASSLKEKKVKVTFGSTTSRPISKSEQRSKPDFSEESTENMKTDTRLGRRLGKQRNEPNGSPSEALPTRLRSPKTSESINCIEDIKVMEDTVGKAPFIKGNRENMRQTFREQDNLKTPMIPASVRSGTDRKLSNNSPTLPFPSLPKIDDNSFLSKVREAVKARLSSFDPKAIGGREAKTCTDMERSASENSNVVLGKNLKENVSYKCKMVCTKS